MMNVLVVDDSHLILGRLASWLRDLPDAPAIRTADTLKDALDCIGHSQPDLVILDLHLPDGNAIQILPAMREMGPDMQIAVLTNDASEINRAKCLFSGANWFFDKSTEFEKALDLVQQLTLPH